MKLLGFHIPFTSKATDLNTVTPIREAYSITSPWGMIVEAFGGAWQRNLVIEDQKSLLAFAAVYSCISLISKDVGKLRLKLMQRAGKIWQEVPDPANPVFVAPNRYQTRNQFIEQWLVRKLIDGNTFVLKERDAQGRVAALYILNTPVVPLVAPDGSVFYRLKPDDLAGVPVGERDVIVPASEIIHDRHTCLWHPLVGVGPIYACGASATQGRKIQANSQTFFTNMSRPSGQLTAPGLIAEETAKRIKEQFETGFSGANLGRILVTGDGLSFQPFTIPAEQAQLIEQQRWTVEDVARAFMVPLYKIGAGTPPSLGSVGALNLEYYQQTLQPYIEAIESLLDQGLGLGPGLGAEFDLEGLVRMDPKTRAETSEIRVRSATQTPNEARQSENLPPLTGGDAAYLQQQNFSLEALAKRDAKEDPFGKSGETTSAGSSSSDTGTASDEEVKALIERLRSREWQPAS